mmetsp:Transcript_40630/g.73003  ORF Transcript_40630/g.73003 Transcript_40630/m.73003 type:complete len:389 (-) Transcript_40630:351-1517(-)
MVENGNHHSSLDGLTAVDMENGERRVPSVTGVSPVLIPTDSRTNSVTRVTAVPMHGEYVSHAPQSEDSKRSAVPGAYGMAMSFDPTHSDVHSLRNHVPVPRAPLGKYPAPDAVRMAVESLDGASKMVQSQIDSGYGKVQYERWQNTLNGILGGAFIAMGGMFSNIIAGGCPGLAATNPGLQKLIGGATFPFGLVMVCLTGVELVTSTFSTVGAAWLAGSLRGNNLRASLNVVHIYLTNFLGALIIAGLAVGSGVLDHDPYKAYSISLAEHKVHQEFHTAVIRGIMCNWLVSLAIFLAFAAQDVTGKVLAIWFPICAFVATGMDHCVANMFNLPCGLMLGADFTIGEMFTHNLIPVTIGNIIGSQLVSAVFGVRFKQTWWNNPMAKKVG